jgi:hypothetical protein
MFSILSVLFFGTSISFGPALLRTFVRLEQGAEFLFFLYQNNFKLSVFSHALFLCDREPLIKSFRSIYFRQFLLLIKSFSCELFSTGTGIMLLLGTGTGCKHELDPNPVYNDWAGSATFFDPSLLTSKPFFFTFPGQTETGEHFQGAAGQLRGAHQILPQDLREQRGGRSAQLAAG